MNGTPRRGRPCSWAWRRNQGKRYRASAIGSAARHISPMVGQQVWPRSPVRAILFQHVVEARPRLSSPPKTVCASPKLLDATSMAREMADEGTTNVGRATLRPVQQGIAPRTPAVPGRSSGAHRCKVDRSIGCRLHARAVVLTARSSSLVSLHCGGSHPRGISSRLGCAVARTSRAKPVHRRIRQRDLALVVCRKSQCPVVRRWGFFHAAMKDVDVLLDEKHANSSGCVVHDDRVSSHTLAVLRTLFAAGLVPASTTDTPVGEAPAPAKTP